MFFNLVWCWVIRDLVITVNNGAKYISIRSRNLMVTINDSSLKNRRIIYHVFVVDWGIRPIYINSQEGTFRPLKCTSVCHLFSQYLDLSICGRDKLLPHQWFPVHVGANTLFSSLMYLSLVKHFTWSCVILYEFCLKQVLGTNLVCYLCS